MYLCTLRVLKLKSSLIWGAWEVLAGAWVYKFVSYFRRLADANTRLKIFTFWALYDCHFCLAKYRLGDILLYHVPSDFDITLEAPRAAS